MSTAIVNIWFSAWEVNYGVFFPGQHSLFRNIWHLNSLIDLSESSILERAVQYMLWGLNLFWKQRQRSVKKTRGWSAHVSTPYECGQETVKWGSGVEMPVPNPANASLRPLHTLSRHSHTRLCLESHALSLKRVNNQGQRKRLWRVAAMCRLSACQAHFFEKHKRGQHGLQAKLRCNQV